MDDSMNGHSMNPLRHAPLPRRDVDPFHGSGTRGILGSPEETAIAREDRLARERGWDRAPSNLWCPKSEPQRPVLNVWQGACVLAMVAAVCALFVLLAGCGLAGPVGVPGPVGATHGDV